MLRALRLRNAKTPPVAKQPRSRKVRGEADAGAAGTALPPAQVRDHILAPYVRPHPRYRALMLIGLMTAICFVYGLCFALFGRFMIVQFVLPIVLLVGLTIWALPELDRTPTIALEVLFFAFFIAVPLWPNYLAIALPGLPWITIVRLTGFPLAACFLVSLSISKAFRQGLAQSLSATPYLWRTLVGFAGFQVFSVALSNALATSINRLIVAQISWTTIYFVSCFVFRRPNRASLWVNIAWAAAVILSLLGVVEFAQRGVPWAGHIPAFLAVGDESVQRTLAGTMRAGTDRYRVQGTYSTSLGLAEFMALLTPFLLHYVAGPYKFVTRICAAISLPLILSTIVLTDSRLGIVGFMLSCLLYVFFWAIMRWRKTRGSLIAPAIVLSYPVLFVAIVGLVLLVPRLHNATIGGSKQASSTDARVEQMREGLPLVFSHPFGHGIARGAAALGFTNRAGTSTIDSYYLLIALDYGIPGFLLFYSMLLIASFNGFRGIVQGTKTREETLLAPLAIAIACFFVIKSIYAGVENQAIIYMMMGMTTALLARGRFGEAPLATRRKRHANTEPTPV